MKTKILSLFVALFATAALWAYDFKSGDLYYNVISPTTVEIPIQEPSDVSNIDIPVSVTYSGQTFYVTDIRDSAFFYWSNLKSITISDSIKSIGKRVFGMSPRLSSVTWNARECYNKAKYNDSKSSGQCYPFYEKTTIQVSKNERRFISIRFPITQFTFGARVEYIPHGLCYGLDKITSVVIPNSVTIIGSSAFEGCTGLTSVTIPNSVTDIGGYAFYGCTGLTHVTIPNSVTSIGSAAFKGCTSLTSITIPNSVTSIERATFYGCTGLTSVTIPNRVTSIGGAAFYGCTGLTSITIPNSVTSIGWDAFKGCTRLNTITIGTNVTQIGLCAFDSCDISSVIWNAKKYEDCKETETPFYYYGKGDRGKVGVLSDVRMGISSFVFGDSVENIPAYLCDSMTNLRNVTIPENVKVIGQNAFRRTPWYDDWYVREGLGCLYMGKILFAYKGKMFPNTSIDVKDGTTNIYSNVFKGCENLTSISIPKSMTKIGVDAFNGCTGLSKVEFAGSVDEWSNILFEDTFSNPIRYARSVYIDNTLAKELTIANRSVVPDVFAYDTCLTSVTILEHVDSIQDSAFFNCTNLRKVTIGRDIKRIGNHAFGGCNSLLDVTWNAKKCADTQWEEKTYIIGWGCSDGKCGDIYATKWHYGPFDGANYISTFQFDEDLDWDSLPEHLLSGFVPDSIVFRRKIKNIKKDAFRGYKDKPKAITCLCHPDDISIKDCYYNASGCTSYNNGDHICNAVRGAYNSGYSALGTSKDVPVYVPQRYYDKYRYRGIYSFFDYNISRYIDHNIGWGYFRDFRALSIAEDTVIVSNSISVIPHNDNVCIVWAKNSLADSYTLQVLSNEGDSVCDIKFNKKGDIIYNRQRVQSKHHVASDSVKAFQYMVDNLTPCAEYQCVLTVKNDEENILHTYTERFKTTGVCSTEITNISFANAYYSAYVYGGGGRWRFDICNAYDSILQNITYPLLKLWVSTEQDKNFLNGTYHISYSQYWESKIDSIRIETRTIGEVTIKAVDKMQYSFVGSFVGTDKKTYTFDIVANVRAFEENYDYGGSKSITPIELEDVVGDAVDNVNCNDNPPQKILKKGSVYILCGGKTYTLTGVEVK